MQKLYTIKLFIHLSFRAFLLTKYSMFLSGTRFYFTGKLVVRGLLVNCNCGIIIKHEVSIKK